MEYVFEHRLALACRDWLEEKCEKLESVGLTSNEKSKDFSSRLYIYHRILPFDWEYFPDTTCPWHFIQWEHCRWDHVYQLINGIQFIIGFGR